MVCVCEQVGVDMCKEGVVA